ncbi:DUF1839 family protein [Phenylobacterium sp.]|uniref:DUF1839 family protein n=1 Tax=Phenylobacterium sp. TaxID=1871053 RepID=UPI002F94D528
MPRLLPIRPEVHQPHPLHAPDRCWPETNCYLDLWIELLNALGLPPEAAMGFTARQDFEGDQFGFSKVPLEDLETLYGLRVQELAIYEPVEAHVLRQMARGRLCLVELDPFWLPDTGQAAYRVQHGKTTVGINAIDVDARRLEYFHNAGYFALEGEDFDQLFRPAAPDDRPFRPYVEFTTLEPIRLSQAELKARAAAILARDWARRPAQNPIRLFQQVYAERAEALAGQGEQAFHDFAFHNPRLLGANFAMLAACLDWLSDGTDARIAHCHTIAETAKAAQFQLARALARRRFDTLAPALEPAADAWDALFEAQAVRDAA